MRVATNGYSVNCRFVGRRIEVTVTLDEVIAICKGTEVAHHRRCLVSVTSTTSSTMGLVGEGADQVSQRYPGFFPDAQPQVKATFRLLEAALTRPGDRSGTLPGTVIDFSASTPTAERASGRPVLGR